MAALGGIAAATSKSWASTVTENTASAHDLSVHFLGTGAAGKNMSKDAPNYRRRSSIIVDGKFFIDLTETVLDIMPSERPDTIFYTHSHSDHFEPATALKMGIKTIYLSNTWYDIASQAFQKAAQESNLPMPTIIPIATCSSVRIGDITITALPANHPTNYLLEQSLIYLIEKGGVRLLYATDTSGIPGVAARFTGIDKHKPGKPITALIMEATMGVGHEDDFRIFAHSSVGTVEQTVKVLKETKRYNPPAGQPVYITHMAAGLHPANEQLPPPLKKAEDGLEVVFTSPK